MGKMLWFKRLENASCKLRAKQFGNLLVEDVWYGCCKSKSCYCLNRAILLTLSSIGQKKKRVSVSEKDLATEICPLTLCSGVYVFNMYVCVCVPNTLGSIIATLNLLFTFGLEDSVFPHIK